MSGKGNWLKRIFGRPEVRAISRHDVWGDAADLRELSGETIQSALTLIPVYAATNLISSQIASLPIQTFRRAGETRERVDGPALFEDPTLFGTRFEWVTRLLVSLLLRGNAYGLITVWDERTDLPRQIEWLHPDDVSILDDRATARPQFFWLGREIDMTRFVHIPAYVVPGSVLGLSPIQQFARTIQTGLLAEKFGRDFFQNGSVPSGVLETDQRVDEDQATAIRERFKKSTKNREPAVLGVGMSYRPITIMPNESQFLQTIQAKTNDIAAIYNIPAERIGGTTGSSRTYANREQDSLDLVEWTLRPWLVKIEEFFERFLPERQFARFNVDALIRADIQTRYTAYGVALRDGWRNRDEIRALEDLPPLPENQGEIFAPPPGTQQVLPASEREHRRALVTQDDVDEATRELRDFFDRQRDEVLSTRVVDVERWNGELEDVLFEIARRASEQAGQATMLDLALGRQSFEYDSDQTTGRLRAQSSSFASGINEATAEDVKNALNNEKPRDALRNVFIVAVSQRAPAIARTQITSATGFGQVEAVRQSGVRASKTWRVTSGNPRSSHSAINGETVAVDENFSNGARWPGDSRLAVEERANCSCEMDISQT